MISLKICLTISLTLMSSTLIPLLSGDLPFFEFVDCSSSFFCRDLWDVLLLYTSMLLSFSFSPISRSVSSCSLSS